MSTRMDASWAALASALCLLGFARARSLPSPMVEPVAAAGRHPPSAPWAPLAANPAPVRGAWRPMPRGVGTGNPTLQLTTDIMEAIRSSHDPAASNLLTSIESSVPPGWEHTFMLHDALLVAGALTEMARMTSFASSSGLESQPRAALSGEALRIQGIADGIARRWLASKYPLLGHDMTEKILREPNRDVVPLLGEYNLVDLAEAVRILGVPVRDATLPPRP